MALTAKHLQVRQKPPSKTSVNYLLLLCSLPTISASLKAFLHVHPHRYHLSKKFVHKHPAFLCLRVLVVCGQWGALISRVLEGSEGVWRWHVLLSHCFYLSHPPGTACEPEQLRILRSTDEMEKLCLGLLWVQSPLGGSIRQIRSASTSGWLRLHLQPLCLVSPLTLFNGFCGGSCKLPGWYDPWAPL